ncbi:hypothetical protein I6I18_06445 [Kytococcus sedentarius]|uniref:Gram-positive cocci surface proteins LPxTG domain-containing protein n=1 Tax=Kytococcus sedentarius (strain ATCC 14392 / DSM 20547 / JCM 11482 / CCUG 33030 / NBRC 15357 / NCTC 11040 / CCM 314 / 541) TaxID=478801 RepID=C7NJ67_KYTSD|nr:hypothetical protein [Kytococcus sedentarius]ACV06754.1 hypothetical protein Ksed_17420 [Kytococcus sedentarius DSM 20547]QQB65026.1 hypothetical protein I6I18_06445 [Kytococcus sedentarius]QRO86640.1 hypothetical protein I6J30_07080 [Kytococcus sedentarius]STX14431.1 Uncharacterised protein [Kytococcus sedentarius]
MRSTTLLITAGLLTAAPAAGATPASPLLSASDTEARACAADSGVTVVVQMPDATHTGCAKGDPASGEEALTQAGFELRHDDSGMVCAIGREDTWYPQEGEEGWTCGDFDGTFWSYWTADEADRRWTSSQVGAAEHDPAVGEAIGWRHGDGQQAPEGGVPVAAEASRGSSTSSPSSASDSPTASDAASDSPSTQDPGPAADGAAQGDSAWRTWALVGGALLIGAGVVAAVLRRR